MIREEPAQVTSQPQEEFDDMILLSDHKLIIADLKVEYEAKIAYLNGVIAKLEAWGNGLQVKLASLQQELYRLKNLVPDLSNVYKGLAKFAPDSFKTAMMLLAFLWAAHQTVFGMYMKAHEKKRRPLWHWGMLVMAGAITFGIILSLLQNPAQAGAAIAATAPYLALLMVAMLIAFIMLRRRKEAKATTP